MCQFIPNQYRQLNWSPGFDVRERTAAARIVHRAIPSYHPSSLVPLPALASQLGLKQILVKDESSRFGLKAFKALGASYAIYRLIEEQHHGEGRPAVDATELFAGRVLEPNSKTFCTATDGNHGRGVAWTARLLRQRAVVYMPDGSAAARVESIRREGAEVIVVDGTYDLAVLTAREEAQRQGWTIISDTSWERYEQIPRWISEGYLTLFDEMNEQVDGVHPDVVIVPGGVGALATTAAWWYRRAGRANATRLVCIEPTSADCLYRSILSPEGTPVTTDAPLTSIMAGLNCGTPSPSAWPPIRAGFDAFMTISDRRALDAMRTYYHPSGGDKRIVSGESGAATMGALLALCRLAQMREYRAWLGLDVEAAVVLLNTEGDTDPEHFQNVVASLPSSP